jgi:hypothetical protein
VVSIFAVALGVLCGTLILAAVTATGRLVGVSANSDAPDEPDSWLKRVFTRLRSRPASRSERDGQQRA